MTSASDVSFAEHVSDLRTRAARARRGALVGAAVAVLLGAAGLILLGLLPMSGSVEDGSRLAWSALEAAALGCFGAGVGHLIAGRGLTGPLTNELGFGPEAKLIRDAVQGKHAVLDAHQQQRADRYAAVASAVLPGQTARLLFLLTGILLNQLAQFTNTAHLKYNGLEVGFSVVVIACMVALITLFAVQGRTLRRARLYSRSHPVT
jgi:hypothetical protein